MPFVLIAETRRCRDTYLSPQPAVPDITNRDKLTSFFVGGYVCQCTRLRAAVKAHLIDCPSIHVFMLYAFSFRLNRGFGVQD